MWDPRDVPGLPNTCSVIVLLAFDVITELDPKAEVDVDRLVLGLPALLRPLDVEDGRRGVQGAFFDQQAQDLIDPESGVS